MLVQATQLQSLVFRGTFIQLPWSDVDNSELPFQRALLSRLTRFEFGGQLGYEEPECNGLLPECTGSLSHLRQFALYDLKDNGGLPWTLPSALLALTNLTSLALHFIRDLEEEGE